MGCEVDYLQRGNLHSHRHPSGRVDVVRPVLVHRSLHNKERRQSKSLPTVLQWPA